MSSPSAAGQDFRALFDHHVDFVWRVLRRHGVPERELEDVCQETFIVVHRKLAEFEGRSTLRTWIYAIAARTAIASRRKAHVRCELLQEPPSEPQSEANQEELATQRRSLSLVEQALASMDSDKREAFVLYELEGMSVIELAAAVGVPENTALYRLHKAREELSQKLRRATLVSEARPIQARVAGGRGV